MMSIVLDYMKRQGCRQAGTPKVNSQIIVKIISKNAINTQYTKAYKVKVVLITPQNGNNYNN